MKLLKNINHRWGKPPRTCEIYTDRIDSSDVDAINTTVKSASTPEGQALAPMWDMVNGHKAGSITDEQYTEQYLALLRQRWQKDKTPFMSILSRRRVVLTCYCAKGNFCHPHLAADVLMKIGAKQNISVVLSGEVEPEVKQLGLF